MSEDQNLCFERAGADGKRCAVSPASGLSLGSVRRVLQSASMDVIPVCGSVLMTVVIITESVVSVHTVGDAVVDEGSVLILTELTDQFRFQSFADQTQTFIYDTKDRVKVCFSS